MILSFSFYVYLTLKTFLLKTFPSSFFFGKILQLYNISFKSSPTNTIQIEYVLFSHHYLSPKPSVFIQNLYNTYSFSFSHHNSKVTTTVQTQAVTWTIQLSQRRRLPIRNPKRTRGGCWERVYPLAQSHASETRGCTEVSVHLSTTRLPFSRKKLANCWYVCLSLCRG